MKGEKTLHYEISEAEREKMIVGLSLDWMIRSADSLREVNRSDLCTGDWIFVRTVNSIYSIRTEQDGLFTIRGGWFDRRGRSPVVEAIRGCTWGGSAIKIDIVAACGLRIEFGNKVITTPVQEWFLFPRDMTN